MNLSDLSRNIRLYPYYKFFQGLIFWQAIWFLYFQSTLSASEAILLYVVFDVSTTILEVPLGYMSDRIGRRITLILSSLTGAISALMMALGSSFEVFALANILLGAWVALSSGTDSAFLYESLVAQNREKEIEEQELRAWRFNFSALAISAALGGVMAGYSNTLAYLAVTAALLASAYIACLFVEVTVPENQRTNTNLGGTLQAITSTLKKPVLIWIFVLSLLMYLFSHIPFVFGQPFILEALGRHGLDGEAPLVSGIVTAIMMLLSVAVSAFALNIRKKLGLTTVLLLAFFIQIAVIAVLAATNSAIAIVFLFLRMVPNSLSQPFILARIQPELEDATRATYLSLQSVFGRLFFALTLLLASGSAADQGQMAYTEIRNALFWYVILGASCLVGLAVAANRIHIETVD